MKWLNNFNSYLDSSEFYFFVWDTGKISDFFTMQLKDYALSGIQSRLASIIITSIVSILMIFPSAYKYVSIFLNLKPLWEKAKNNS